MAMESEHREQARHNADFLRAIDGSQFPDWVVTVAFYRAVHLVEMLFARDNRPAGGSHIGRNQVLKRHYPDVWREYRPLYDLSRKARYWCMAITPQNMTYAIDRLVRIEQIITTLTT